MRCAAGWLIASVLAGCTVQLAEGSVLCGPARECPPDWSCHGDGVCRRSPAEEGPWGGLAFEAAGPAHIADVVSTSAGVWVTGSAVSPLRLGGTDHSPAGPAAADDAFVAHFDAEGALVWVRVFGGSGRDTFEAVSLNPGPSLLYVAGSFEDGVDFTDPARPGPLASAGGSDAVLLALNATNGDVIWSRSFGGSGDESGDDLARWSDRVCMSGKFDGPADFGAGEVTPESSDPYVLCVDGGSGDVLFADATFGAPQADPAPAIAMDDDGSLYLATSAARLFVEGTPVDSEGRRDAFVRAYDRQMGDWTHRFTERYGGPNDELGSTMPTDGFRAIAVTTEALYVAGHLQNEVTLGSFASTESPAVALYVLALDPTDGSVRWVERLTLEGGLDSPVLPRVAMAPTPVGLLVAGQHGGTITHDPSGTSVTLLAGATVDAFLLSLDPTAADRFVSLQGLGATSFAVANAVTPGFLGGTVGEGSIAWPSRVEIPTSDRALLLPLP